MFTESLFDIPPSAPQAEPAPSNTLSPHSASAAAPQFAKYEQAFDKFAAAQVAIQDVWELGSTSAMLSPAMMAPKPLSAFMTPQELPADVYVSPAEIMSSSATTVRSNFSDLDYSPMYENPDVTEAPDWDPLFPDVAPAAAPQEDAHTNADELQCNPSASPQLSVASPQLSQRRRSSSPKTSIRRGPNGNRVDDMGITIYSRKPRTMPLRPVEIPETADTATAKRARNTEAARRSRARKLERMAQLEDRVKQLVDRNEELEAEVQRLKAIAGEL
ncbi:General control protein GCN4 [Wickerhamiella sorbophila]|uniref:General control protein GCN4 n=1 Tax=Wickerhamiella sorbophila TaxID=45607 RepID=A0A2T0FK37_9ASCO|nr:General control protein GCN4 [Wickerhamiella sorbophila]PRT55356.1 General control protein GCN4 [Wickerhamiella sorbophila]